jgi:hypothetical protein
MEYWVEQASLPSWKIVPFCVTISLRDQSNESVLAEKAFAGSS